MALMLSLPFAACGSDGIVEPPPPPPPTPTVTIAVSPASLSVTAGESRNLTVTITRGGGFTGPVTISGSGAPAGVTVAPVTIAAASTSAEITFAASNAAAVGAANLSITGTATGVTIAPAAVALTVTAAPLVVGQIGTQLEGEFGGDEFGTAIALSANGNRVVIGAPYNDGSGSDAGHARVFERNGTNWVQLGADLDGEAAGDWFGRSVAITDNGNRVAVGAYLNDGGGTSSGHVRVFDYSGGVWTQVGADIDGPPGRGMGWSVAMNASGTRVVIGGPTQHAEAGEVKVYELIGGAWTQLGSTLAGQSEFGHAVSMSDNGNRIALSFPSASGGAWPGFTRVHDWNGSAWIQVGGTIAGEAIGDFSGGSISLSGDGSMIAIGAENNVGGGIAGGGGRGGHVRVYRLTSGAWVQVGSDIDSPNAGGNFGASVSLSADGNRLIATGNGGGKESVGVYNLTGNTWTKASAPSFGTGGRMGAVAISADGKTAAVGEVYHNNARGAVRLYNLQ